MSILDRIGEGQRQVDNGALGQVAATRGRLALAVTLAAIVPLLALALISIRQQEAVAIDDAYARLDGLASAQVSYLEGIIDGDRDLAGVLATNSNIRRALGSYASGDDLPLVQSSGQLAQVVAASDRLSNVALYDTTGGLVTSVDPGAPERYAAAGLDPGTQELVVRVIAAPLVGTRAITTTPVVTNGELVGTLLIETDATPIAEIAADYSGLSRTGETSVAQPGPDGAQFIAPLRFRDGAVLDLTVPAGNIDAPITLAMLGDEGRHDGTIDYRGADVLAVTRYIQSTGWGVVVKMDTAEALAGVAQFRSTVLAALAVSTILLIAVSSVVSRSVWRPVSEVTEAAVAVARGDRDRRASVNHGGEIGALARAVNSMTDDLVAGADADAARRRELEAVNARLSARELELRHQAAHDPLTGLPNRMQLRRSLDEAIDARSTEAAVLFLDLDQFKLVNDSRGHSAGDELLRQVAARLRDAVAAGDMVGRFGGDEFVVLRPELGPALEGEAMTLAREIHRAFAEPVVVGEEPVHVAFSIGVALTAGECTSDSVIADADVAMYEAKANGRNQTVLFDREMRGMVESRHEIETWLRRAIPAGEIAVHYQPIVELATGEICAVEALARWNRPDGTPVSPVEFIAVAEDSGLIVPLGRSIFRQVCAQQARWAALHPDSGVRLAVNVSAAELIQPDYLDFVRTTLTETGAAADHLTIELTETVLSSDIETAVAHLLALRELGFLIALDDFGTGYSSLTYVRELPIDAVKIDRSFMSEISDGVHESSIVSVIVGLGRILHVAVIAEGVETDRQLAALRELGCDHAQGFVFSEARSADAVEQLLWPDIDLIAIRSEAA